MAQNVDDYFLEDILSFVLLRRRYKLLYLYFRSKMFVRTPLYSSLSSDSDFVHYENILVIKWYLSIFWWCLCIGCIILAVFALQENFSGCIFIMILKPRTKFYKELTKFVEICRYLRMRVRDFIFFTNEWRLANVVRHRWIKFHKVGRHL